MTATVAAAAAELATLFPHLAAAMARDNTTETGHAITAGIPVNADVLKAADILHREIPAACARCCALTGEPWQKRGVARCLTALPRLAGRLHALGLVEDVRFLEEACRGWVRVTKAALGLRNPDVPVGYDCPVHEGPPAGLLAAGAEGFLRRGRAGVSVEWAAGGRIFCPWCGASWGPGEWLMLGRVLQEAT